MISELVLNALRKTQNNGASETRAAIARTIYFRAEKKRLRKTLSRIFFSMLAGLLTP